MEQYNKKRGLLIVLSGPSGVGKGTVCNHLKKVYDDISYSISITTRSPRFGEKDGENYFFKSKEEFEVLIQKNELLEWAEYVGNYYGTPKQYIEENLAAGNDILLEIEVRGAIQIKNLIPEGIFIFLVPPTFEVLKERIIHRGTETEDSLQRRLLTANEELEQVHNYNYIVTNDEVSKACDRIRSIIIAESLKKERLI